MGRKGKDSIFSEKNPSFPDLVATGSCGLHVLHGGYETTLDSAEWNIGKKCLKP